MPPAEAAAIPARAGCRLQAGQVDSRNTRTAISLPGDGRYTIAEDGH